MTDDRSKQKKPDSCSFVIFGVTGDLAHRLVLPALYNLAATDLLPDKFCVVGIARKPMSNDALRDSLMKGVREFATRPVDDAIAKRLLECVTCIAADPKDPASFDRMRERLEKLEANRTTGGNRLFYLATPPGAFAPIARELGRTGLLKEDGSAWRRLVVEKPFGTDLASARALNSELLRIVDEHQIYRIDHYLGKETVQNILVLRFANGMFEPIWNRNHIDHIQITVDEKLGVGHRGSFYDVNRRAARHGAEPPFPTVVAGRDGAADPVRCAFGSFGKSRRARGDPDPERGGGIAQLRARPVRRRQDRRHRHRRLSQDRRRQSRIARPRLTPR